MTQPRTTSTARIGVLAGVFSAALLVIVGHLFTLMVEEQEVWAQRSYKNRWAFRSVPSLRGRLLDRNGAVLAQDEATTRVSVHYALFRLRHCVGAAVHGASVYRKLEDPTAAWRYGYEDGRRGPREAARDLFSIPVSALAPGALPKDIRAQLATYATTVLSQLGERSRRQAYRAMREAAQAGQRLGIGDVLDVTRQELAARFDQRLQELRDLSQRLRLEQEGGASDRPSRTPANGAVVGAPKQARPSLMAKLDDLRVASFDKRQVTWKDEDGREQRGSLIEELRVPVADGVAFDVAASLRVEAVRNAGVTVEPSVQRARRLDGLPSLDALVGRVNWLDRTIAAYGRLRAKLTGVVPPTWVDRYLNEQMPAGWAQDLVPEGLVDDAARSVMIEEARRRYQRDLLVRERRGVTGFESWFNSDLMGQLGMRFVEHDGDRREQSLWSHLDVESGGDVQITIDRGLQAIAERLVGDAWRTYDAHYRGLADPRRQAAAQYVEAAMAVIDVRTGDVLACAGAPVTTENARHVPGVMWLGNGSIGSIAKPFVLVEQLESSRLGRAHTAPGDVEMCSGEFRYRGLRLRCAQPHWGGGQSPRDALAKSCNCFFYQVGVGLGGEGVRRAFERFGLLEPEITPSYALCWQDQLRGISAAPGNLDAGRPVPSWAIGYGVQVSPLFVARAYAGIATGALPTLGLRAGVQRDRVTVPASRETLDVVRAGLDDVVQRGTARELRWLAELGVCGKTGTAERTSQGDNNAWFAGYLPAASASGHQLAFCSVIYYVPDQSHGGDTAGAMAQDFFAAVASDPELSARYMPR